MIHLDTSFVIRAVDVGSPQDRIFRSWLAAGEPLAMSTIAWAEFLCGPVDDDQVELLSRVVAERVPFVDDDARLAARLFEETGRRRGSLADCMIAAVAIGRHARLATLNPSDFRRFHLAGLALAHA